MAYAIYARKSEESEERQIQSIDDQLRLNRRRADEHGLLVTEEIVESKSAKEPERREGFTQLLKLIDRGKIDGIIAWHPDRLSRNEIEAAAITYRIRHGKIKDLQFVNYFFDNSPEGIMMLQMALSQSQYYSSKLSKDVTRGMVSKMEKGWSPHRAPEGYLNDPFTRTTVPDPERFDTIRRFWDLILTQEHNVPQALEILNDTWGYRTKESRRSAAMDGASTKKRGGGPLSKASAYGLLKNVFYTGHFVVNGTTYKGSHPPMVTPTEFNAVQQWLGRTTKSRYSKHAFAYTGLIRCSHCGCQITASTAKGKYKPGEWTYYYCTNGRKVCRKQGIEESALEEKIDALLRTITIAKEVEVFILASVAKWHDQQSGLQQNIYEDQMKALAEAQRQLTALLDLKLRDLIDDSDFSTKHNELKAQTMKLKQELDGTEDEFERVRESAVNTAQFLAHAHDRFLLGSLEDKREIARALGLTYTFDGTDLQIELHPALLVSSTFEHEFVGSGSTKKTDFLSSVSCGGAEDSLVKLLYAFFKNRPSFPALLCLQSGVVVVKDHLY